MSIEKLLDSRLLRNLRAAVGTIRAIMFLGVVVISALGLLLWAVRYFSINRAFALTITGVVILLLLGAAYAWYYVTRVFDPAFYEIVELNGILQVTPVNDHHRYEYVREQTVKATRDDLRLIEFRAHWTGQGDVGSTMVTSTRPEHAVLDGRRAESDDRVHRWVYPRRALNRGDELKVGLKQVHEDNVKPQLPYFREGGGRYRTRKITISVTLRRDDYVAGSIEGKIWDTNQAAGNSRPVGKLHPSEHGGSTPDTVEYVVTIERPRPYHSYGIEWTWAKQRDY